MIPYATEEKKEDEGSIISYDYRKAKEIKWYDRILLNRPLKVIFALILVSVLTPVLIYRFVFLESSERPPPDGHSFGSCLVSRDLRIPCGREDTPQEQCHAQCCYDLQNDMCFHRFPSRFSYLILPQRNWTEEVVMTPRLPTVPFNLQPSVPRLRLSVDEITSTHLSLTWYDSRNTSLNGSRIEDTNYDYHISSPEFNIAVNGTEGPIFNTMRGPLIASDNIWEIVFKLTDQSMYGLGEIPLRPGTVKVLYNHDGDHSSVPLIFARNNESYHGVLIDMKTPTEVSIGNDNQVIMRSITKTELKLHLFVGPEPKDIMKDVMALIGSKERLEYWMLGAHVCSEVSESDDEALSALTSFISSANTANFWYTSQCGIRPLVFDAHPAVSAPVVTGATAVRNANRRFVPHISPLVRYEVEEHDEQVDGKEEKLKAEDEREVTTTPTVECTNLVCEFADVMLQRNLSEHLEPYAGTANKHTFVYPDYTNENINALLARLWIYDVELHGAILENSWPLDDSRKFHNETYLQLPYFNKNFEGVFDNTPQWDAERSQGGLYVYGHNSYGNEFLDAFESFLNRTPSIPTWSTSQWMKNSAAVNRQNVPTSWTSLRAELVAAALGGASGHWLWSSPICGDTDNFDIETHASLCVKWYMAATFFPLTKIHSKTTRRDGLAFEGTHRNLILNSLNQRMNLLPYFHTVLQEGPLLRPMFFQFPFSENLVDLSSQFSVGDDLLIIPNLQPSQSHVHFWMPPGTWYELMSGLKIDGEEGDVVTMMTTEADFMALIRGGSIVPMQRTIMNTVELTRQRSDFTLVVATERKNLTSSNQEETGKVPHATGHLQMADDMTIHFTVTDRQLLITSEGQDFNSFCGGSQAVWANIIRNIDIYGLDEEFNNFDHHRNVNIVMGINLCNLRNGDITHTLF